MAKETEKIPLTPLYSDGQADNQKNNQGSVEGPKGGKATPNPLGFPGGLNDKK